MNFRFCRLEIIFLVCISRGVGRSSKGGGANWPKVVFLFLVQGEKCVCGGGANDTLPPPTFESVCVWGGGGHGPCGPTLFYAPGK